MSLDKQDSIDSPIFTCCYEQTTEANTINANNIPSKILYQTRTTDPKSDLKGNYSSNILPISPDSPSNVKAQAKINDKRSIRQKKGKDNVKNQPNSPQNEQNKGKKKMFNKESHHHTKMLKLQKFQGQQNSNEPIQQLAIYDSDHVKASQKPQSSIFFNSPQRVSGIDVLKTDKRSCILSLQDSSPMLKNHCKNKKISINTHIANTQNQQKNDSPFLISANDRKISEKVSNPQQYSSPSNNSSFNNLQTHFKNQMTSPQNTKVKFFQSTNQSNLKLPQVQIIKPISSPNTPENRQKKDSFRPFFSENNPNARNSNQNKNQVIEQSKNANTDLPMSRHNLLIPNTKLIQSKIERSINDNLNPESARNLLQVQVEKKRDCLKLPRKSDLEMLKASCISEVDGIQEQNQNGLIIKKENSYLIKVSAANGSNMDSDKQKSSNPGNNSVKNSFNTNKSLVSKLGTSKMTSYQLKLAGLGSMTVNSFAQSVNQSKINQKIQQSVVMQDFFNPAKALFSKWGKGGSDENPNENEQ